MLINLRNALMAGKKLPYDAEVEFLELTGTQYVKVPMVVDNSATVNITGYTGISNTELFSFDMERKKSFNIESGATYYRWWTNNYINLGSGYVGVLHSYKCNSSIWVDGVLKGTSTATDTDKTTAFYIFKGSHNPARGRIYHASVEYGGALIFDGIPVRKGTVGYLYDRVSGRLFGNAGTGDFVLGPDVVPVEWLGSDGNQYIDTGYVFQFGDDVAATFQPLATPTQTAYFFGADTAYNAGLNVHYDPTAGDTGVRFCYGGGDNHRDVIMSPAQGFSTSTIYTCNGNTNKRTINSGENTASVQDSGLNSASVILFCGRRNANVRPASTGWAIASRFFGFDAKRNGAGIRAIKPVRVGTGTTWEGAMMDVLTRRIYRNAGTGAFTYGNDLPYPIPAE